MANSSLDLSDRGVLGSLARLLSAVGRAAGDTPVLLIGAAARDLLLVHAHGVEVQRATEDTDLALAVRNWEAFLRLRGALITSGSFTADIWMFLRHYADAGNEDRLYGEEGEAALAAFAFDVETAGAWLLGKDAREVLAHGADLRRSLESLDAILMPEIDPDGALRLVAQMPPGDRDRQLSLLTSFSAGLFETGLSKT